MKEYEREKMSIAVTFAHMMIINAISQYRNNEITIDEFKNQINMAKDGFYNVTSKLEHLDRFEKERAFENLIKSIRRKIV